jgi:hypothetical protein
LPDTLRALLSRVRARLRARAAAHAFTAGGALFALLMVGALPLLTSVVAALIVALAIVAWQWRIGDPAIAREIETRHPLDNLLITAIEIEQRPRPLSAEIRDAVWQQATAGARGADAARIVALAQPVAVVAAVLIGCVLLARNGNVTEQVRQRLGTAAASTPVAPDISVRVQPPAYTQQPIETQTNPTQLTVVSGTAIRIESASRVLREWIATASESLDLRVDDSAASRFLLVNVIPDAPPSVRITTPGRDTALASPDVAMQLEVDSTDDLGLASLSLRYTKASGGGENVTFTEGELPLSVERVNTRQWRARAHWPLAPLGLGDGDVLVYRALARDANPNGEAVESDAFLIEIGRAAEIASAGFALPTEERKYAISQQMVIYKTEQLQANRARHPDDWLEQTRMIGLEQRMVRAEVVFLSGGEVQDEVEEAAHSHELAEGRLENRGRAEMVRALNFMSRAEAQLNDGNATGALVFERQALASLERALDRRRYFLRTLPDRARIDITRRLTGERGEARSWTRAPVRTEPTLPDDVRVLMRDLADAAAGRRPVDASLAARVGAIDPRSAMLQKSAVAIASAQTAVEQQTAVGGAMAAVAAHALAALPAAGSVYFDRDPLAGRLADESSARPRQ